MCSLKVFAYAPWHRCGPQLCQAFAFSYRWNMPAAPQKPGGPICAEGHAEGNDNLTTLPQVIRNEITG